MSSNVIKKCFVIMPYGANNEYHWDIEEANDIFDKIIEPAVRNVAGRDVEIIRQKDKNESGSITTSIVREIAAADLCIVDITGRNPNVFFELGIRYALKKKFTIIMHQKDNEIPFDIKPYRSVQYKPVSVDRYRLDLEQTIKDSINSKSISDGLVFDALPMLEVSLGDDESVSVMPWRLYWKKFLDITSRLDAAYDEDRYRPDALIGITKGGGMFADLLHQKSKLKCPVLTLWADRDKKDYFGNPINLGALGGLKETLKKPNNEIKLLLVDDIIASGNTFFQAIEFISSEIPHCNLAFLPMVYKKDSNYRDVSKHILWKDKAFDYADSSIDSIHLVNRWTDLPYYKNIRSR